MLKQPLRQQERHRSRPPQPVSRQLSSIKTSEPLKCDSKATTHHEDEPPHLEPNTTRRCRHVQRSRTANTTRNIIISNYNHKMAIAFGIPDDADSIKNLQLLIIQTRSNSKTQLCLNTTTTSQTQWKNAITSTKSPTPLIFQKESYSLFHSRCYQNPKKRINNTRIKTHPVHYHTT